MSNWTFSPPMRRSKSRDAVRPSRWKKHSFPSSAAMKPKPRSETTFLIVPVVTATSTPLSNEQNSRRTVSSRKVDHTKHATDVGRGSSIARLFDQGKSDDGLTGRRAAPSRHGRRGGDRGRHALH